LHFHYIKHFLKIQRFGEKSPEKEHFFLTVFQPKFGHFYRFCRNAEKRLSFSSFYRKSPHSPEIYMKIAISVHKMVEFV